MIDTFSSHMDTLSEGINKLKEEGFTAEFRVNKECKLECSEKDSTYSPNESQIKRTLRFEGSSNPSDMSILYGIKTEDGVKGLLINGYGVSNNDLVSEFVLSATNM